jgi:hypothetical protein
MLFDVGLVLDLSNTSANFTKMTARLAVIFPAEDSTTDSALLNFFVQLFGHLHPRFKTAKDILPILSLNE